MDSDHLSSVALESLESGRGDSHLVLTRALDHLARRCPTCEAVLEGYPRELVAARAAGAYSASRRRASRRLLDLAAEREAAPVRIAELLERRIVAEALVWASGSLRFHTWGLASVLTERSEEALEERPREARVWAQLAVAVAARLDPAVYGERVVAEARALAGVRFGLALLEVQGDLAGAEHELGLAAACARAAPDPAAIEAEIELARCRLDLAAGRFAEVRQRAEALERRASGGRLAELRLEGLLLLGRALRGAGELSFALAAFRVLRAVLRRHGDLAAMERRAGLEIGECLCRLGRHEEALRELRALDLGSEDEAGRTIPRRAYWAGVCLHGLGRIEEAEEALEAAWRELAAEGTAVEAVRAFLDLVGLHVGAGRLQAAADLLEEAECLYRIEGLPRPGARALLRLQTTAARGELDSAGVAEARARLEPLPEGPALRPPIH